MKCTARQRRKTNVLRFCPVAQTPGSNMVAGVAQWECLPHTHGVVSAFEPVAGACVSVSSTTDSFLFPVGMTPKLHVLIRAAC